MRFLLLVPLIFATLALAAQQPVRTTSTMCQASEVVIGGDVVERRLIGCGAGFAENLLWHLDRSDSLDGTLDGGVTRQATGRGAVIYVFDTGVLRDHVEFQRATGSNVIAGIDAGGHGACAGAVLAPCFDPRFPTQLLFFGHGTGVASVAAGARTGVAPDASIVSVMYRDADTMLKALREVIRHAYDPMTPSFRTGIISYSLSIEPSAATAELTALIQTMVAGVDADGNADPNGKRFLFVAKAGNYYSDDDLDQCAPDRNVDVYPGVLGASTDGVITVGGLDRHNAMWDGSCSGDLVELLAPAADILVASIGANDTYRYKPVFYSSGTSWATPYVAGMAARLLERDPTLTPAQIEAALKASPSRVAGLPVAVLQEAVPVTYGKRRAARH